MMSSTKSSLAITSKIFISAKRYLGGEFSDKRQQHILEENEDCVVDMFLLQEAKQTHVVEVFVLEADLKQHGAVPQKIYEHIKSLTLCQGLARLKYAGNYFFEFVNVGAASDKNYCWKKTGQSLRWGFSLRRAVISVALILAKKSSSSCEKRLLLYFLKSSFLRVRMSIGWI
jgi:hypothetical protein